MNKFIEAIDFNRVDSVLWHSICCRLRNTCSSPLDPDRFKGLKFVHGESHFEGIIHHLSLKCGGNVHTKDLVSITPSSTYSGQQSVETITDFGRPSNWYTQNVANSWLLFDFKSAVLSIDGYYVNSGGMGAWLVDWVMEVSSDGSSWVTIDERRTTELKGPNRTKYFECTSPCAQLHRMVRIRQTGPNGSGSHQLGIGNIEFFGRLWGAKATQ
jgi:hypothetical protein